METPTANDGLRHGHNPCTPTPFARSSRSAGLQVPRGNTRLSRRKPTRARVTPKGARVRAARAFPPPHTVRWSPGATARDRPTRRGAYSRAGVPRAQASPKPHGFAAWTPRVSRAPGGSPGGSGIRACWGPRRKLRLLPAARPGQTRHYLYAPNAPSGHRAELRDLYSPLHEPG
jgi:hypothetical protein